MRPQSPTVVALRKEILANLIFGRRIFATPADTEDVIWQTIGDAIEAAECMADCTSVDGALFTSARAHFLRAAATIRESQEATPRAGMRGSANE